MQILVIGANGRVGNLLTESLIKKNYNVIGTSRHSEMLFENSNYRQINLDLSDDLDLIESNIPDSLDAIYFVSGSRGKNLLQIDLHGAIKTMQAAENLNIKRFIMLSSVFSLQPEKWKEHSPEDLVDYNIAKHYADQWLINNTNLNYTILQPGALTETDGSGKIKVNIQSPGKNSIENVVNTLVEVLESKSTSKKVISMHDGDTSIKQAIAELQ